MSFEGYDQFLCRHGHYWTCDVYDPDWNSDNCPECGESPVWSNMVDETNGSYCDCPAGEWETNFPCVGKQPESCGHCKEGRIDGYVELEIDKPAETKTCECCGHTTIVKQATYKIPEFVGYKDI